MVQIRKQLFGLLLTAFLIFLFVQSAGAGIVRHYDPQLGKEDLLLLGFGELTLHGLSVTGNSKAFESGNPWLDENLSANYRASLFANGNLTPKLLVNGTAIIDSRIEDEYRTVDPSIFRLRMSLRSTEPLWDGWRFTGEGLYDPHRLWEFGNLDTRLLTQPQEPSRLELLARLESDKYGYIEGGSLHPGFGDTKFSLRQRSLFGVFADLKKGPVGAEMVAGKLEGKAFREGAAVGIRADGTSGPFDLTHAPVTRGSEVVKIEARDRFNESTILSSRTLVRDVDYNIDYLRGRIILHQPVASETTASDPVYIAITYDYQRSENDDLLGSRVRVTLVDEVQAGVAYLHRFIDNGASGPGEDEPENLQAADLSVDLKKAGNGYFEIARSDEPDSADHYQAIRAGLESKVIDNLALKADFMRIDDKYRSFTNSDLDPVKNQQRLDLCAGYDIKSGHNISASFSDYRGLSANGKYNSYSGLRDEKIYALGYRSKLTSSFGLGLKVERRDVKDRADLSHEDNRQDRAIVDVEGNREKIGLLGKVGYGLHYEFIAFRNSLEIGTDDNNTNQLALSLTSAPHEGTSIQLTQKFRLSDNRELECYDEREDASFASVRVQPWANLSTLATAEYKRFTVPGYDLTLWPDDPYKIERAGTFALEYIPLDKIKGLGKVGRYEIEQWRTDSLLHDVRDFAMGQFTYFRNHHLSFNLESEYRRTTHQAALSSCDKTWDFGIRLNWNRDRFTDFTAGIIRRWQSKDFRPSPEVKSTSYILLVNGSASLGHNFFARGSIKGILLRDIIDDEKTYTQIEIGYENPRWYRVSIGYERIESENDISPDRYYRGHGAFMRLVGKF